MVNDLAIRAHNNLLCHDLQEIGSILLSHADR
jgi:hypothetical protein